MSGLEGVPLGATLAQRLRARREALRLSQAAAAQRANVTLRTWQRWESGETALALKNLPIMAEALETTSQELLGANPPRSREELTVVERLTALEHQLQDVELLLRRLVEKDR